MPHVKSKTSGRIFHDISSETAALFVEAGLYEYFTPIQLGSKTAPRPTVPTFFVGLNNERNRFEIVCTLPNGGVQRFDGAPSRAKVAFKALAWDAKAQAQTLQGPEPSPEIITQYARLSAEVQSEAHHLAVSKQRAQEMQERAENQAQLASQAAARAGQ